MIIPLPSSLRRIMRRIIDSAESSSGQERQMERGLEVLSKRALANFTHSSKVTRSIVIVNGNAASFIFSFSFFASKCFFYILRLTFLCLLVLRVFSLIFSPQTKQNQTKPNSFKENLVRSLYGSYYIMHPFLFLQFAVLHCTVLEDCTVPYLQPESQRGNIHLFVYQSVMLLILSIHDRNNFLGWTIKK